MALSSTSSVNRIPPPPRQKPPLYSSTSDEHHYPDHPRRLVLSKGSRSISHPTYVGPLNESVKQKSILSNSRSSSMGGLGSHPRLLSQRSLGSQEEKKRGLGSHISSFVSVSSQVAQSVVSDFLTSPLNSAPPILDANVILDNLILAIREDMRNRSEI